MLVGGGRNEEGGYCFCLTLRLAAMLILWINALCGVTGLITAVLYAYDPSLTFKHDLLFYLIFYDQIAWVFFSFLALYGALMKEPLALKPLLYLWMLRIFIYSLAIICTLIAMMDGSTYLANSLKYVHGRSYFKHILFEWQLGLVTLTSLFIGFFIGLYISLVINNYVNALQEEYELAGSSEDERKSLINTHRHFHQRVHVIPVATIGGSYHHHLPSYPQQHSPTSSQLPTSLNNVNSVNGDGQQWSLNRAAREYSPPPPYSQTQYGGTGAQMYVTQQPATVTASIHHPNNDNQNQTRIINYST